jgi:hypothetical protein
VIDFPERGLPRCCTRQQRNGPPVAPAVVMHSMFAKSGAATRQVEFGQCSPSLSTMRIGMGKKKDDGCDS